MPYDSQEKVYDQFFDELGDAVKTLHEHIGNRLSKSCDYVYYGDPAGWILFGNSLKLRLAMRISFVNPQKARKLAEEAVADGVIETNDNNATWKYFNSLTNPLYTAVNYNNDGSVTGGDTHAAADIICYMNGYNDPAARHTSCPARSRASSSWACVADGRHSTAHGASTSAASTCVPRIP